MGTAKTKALISCAVTVQLICVFIFAYAKSHFLITRLKSSCILGFDQYLCHFLFRYLKAIFQLNFKPLMLSHKGWAHKTSQ